MEVSMENIEKTSIMVLPVEFLWEGLVLPEDVYNHDGTVLLVPKGEVITKTRLQHLYSFDVNDRYITTGVKSYKTIMEGNGGHAEMQQRQLEYKTGYNELKHGMREILLRAKIQPKVESEQAEAIMDDVFFKMKHLELTEIFNCIDTPRPMDERLQRHCLNVGILNGVMGQWLKLPEQEIKLLIVTGVLHDIGKTKIPEEILNAPRKLTEEEFKVIQRHPVYSYELLGDGFDARVKNGVLNHHERMDGSGYPRGLKGDELDVFSRVTAVSDVYDAMVSARCYKGARIPFDILDQFMKAEHRGLDLQVTALLTKNMIEHFRDSDAEMSDGQIGKVRYIPPNDINHPIVQAGDVIKQVDEDWYCVRINA
jgi:HD-GYP domain-containing protein (c-di-GMP phosphodiesterase class II)